MDDDHTLLSRFAKAKDEAAFTELVRRHLDLVYGVCLRRTGSRSLAEELVQNVFASLARKAGSLKPEVLVVGWLHRAAHLESLSAFRSESSRLRKMKNYMDHLSDFDPEPDRFREISPFLDQALDSLPPSDRDVVLLRFASDLTLQQIGNRLGKSESAAQRHLQRVLEKLAIILRRRGVTTSATALALMLGADFAKAAPASLTVAFVSKTAIASAAAGGFTLIKLTTLLYIMKNKAIIIASACLLVAGGSAVYISTRPPASAAAKDLAKDSASGPVSSASKDPVSAISQEIVANSSSRRPRPVSEYQELDEKYGVSQVRLAKSATDTWIKFVVGTSQLKEFMAARKSKLGGENKDQADDPLSSVPELTLTAEQKAKINAAHVKRMTTEKDAIRALQARFTKNRTDVIEMVLASDAAYHGKMGIAEFQAVLDGKKELLLALSSLTPKDDTIQHPFYRSELPSILDQDQLAIFEKFRTEQAAASESEASDDQQVILGIKETSDGPDTDARTLEQIDSDLRKLNIATESGLKIVEALGDLKEGK
jgi:RNA polymerase sigma factor (sigma-70 family)